ncbi:MAG: hypothetical protein IT198_04540 [Acidimicrobiia bacterium]|nr:hypothetical protein [Acidimicrobiia bacterium]
MIAGIVVKIVAAFFAGLGIVLMRFEARRAEAAGAAILAVLVRRPIWLLGALCQLVTGALTFVAFQLAPIPVVQPFSAAALVFIVLFSRPVLGERPGRREVGGTLVVLAGLVLALVSAGEETDLVPIDGLAFALTLLVLTGYCAGMFVWYGRHTFESDTAAGVVIGSVTGTALGVATTMFRVIGVAVDPGEGDWVPPPAMLATSIAILVVFGGFGFATFQNALRRHRATAVAPSDQVTVLLVPIAIAVLAFGQVLPAGLWVHVLRFFALGVIVAGVVILSTSPTVAEELEVAEPDGALSGAAPHPDTAHQPPPTQPGTGRRA